MKLIFLSEIFVFFTSMVFICPVFAQSGENHILNWRKLIEEKSDCVTWVSCTMRIEVSTGGRSFPPNEQKLEALGTVLGEDGLIILSLNEVDPTFSIISRMRRQADVNVNYTEVLILQSDGTEIAADFLLKDEDLDLAFIKPKANYLENNKKPTFQAVEYEKGIDLGIEVLNEVVSMGKLGRNLFRKSTLQVRRINAVIAKPRDYYVAENLTPGTPVFDQLGRWIGIAAFRKENGKPNGVIIVPAQDVMETAQQVRERIK